MSPMPRLAHTPRNVPAAPKRQGRRMGMHRAEMWTPHWLRPSVVGLRSRVGWDSPIQWSFVRPLRRECSLHHRDHRQCVQIRLPVRVAFNHPATRLLGHGKAQHGPNPAITTHRRRLACGSFTTRVRRCAGAPPHRCARPASCAPMRTAAKPGPDHREVSLLPNSLVCGTSTQLRRP